MVRNAPFYRTTRSHTRHTFYTLSLLDFELVRLQIASVLTGPPFRCAALSLSLLRLVSRAPSLG